MSSSTPSLYLYSLVVVPIPSHETPLFAFHPCAARGMPDTWIATLLVSVTFLHPPTGPMVFSYHRTPLASNHWPWFWYSVPCLCTPGGRFSGANRSCWLDKGKLDVIEVVERLVVDVQVPVP